MTIKVVELFAGVGGFRVGLEGYPKRMDSPYSIVWSNQWEPSTKMQHANLVYLNKWPNANHSGEDISEVNTLEIPDHDLMAGGFPCQDYSVATTLKNSKGLIGKKGVLWWQIFRILEEKGDNRPNYLFFENVDRLIKSPASQRGRDFAMILSSLNSLGYAVEWRVINAADYGMPQRRRRVFFLGYRKGTKLYEDIINSEKKNWITEDGILASSFPVSIDNTPLVCEHISDNLVDVSENFNKGKKNSPFENSGLMINGDYYTLKTYPEYSGKKTVLKDILLDLNEVPQEFHINGTLDKWEYLKGAKDEIRTNKTLGFQYKYNEGPMVFPDSLDKPSRTIITGEGGPSPSRFKHVINQNGKLRRLTPIELERLNMFPDDHTKLEGITDTKRAFFMGNALVVGVIAKIGETLAKNIKKDEPAAV